MVDGVRRNSPGAIVKAPIDDDEWHTLSVRADGPVLKASLDGTSELTTYDTYFGRGRVGVWTKSDAISEFDDLRFEPIAAAAAK